MPSPISSDRQQKMADHLLILRSYAAQVLVDKSPLNNPERSDLTSRMHNFLEIGSSIGCTESTLVKMLLRDCFDQDY